MKYAAEYADYFVIFKGLHYGATYAILLFTHVII